MTFLGDVFAFFLLRVRLFGLEESFEMGLHGPPRGQGIHRGVRFHLGGVEEQLLPPYQSRLKALLNDPLEEAPEALQTVALPDPGEARVIGQRFVQVVSEKPADAQAVGGHPHELALRADILEELITSCKRKKTTGSTDGLPPSAYKGRTSSLTKERSTAASRRR